MTFTKVEMLALAMVALTLVAAPLSADHHASELKAGKADLQSAGPLAFGPNGILFAGDSNGAAIFALDTGARQAVFPSKV